MPPQPFPPSKSDYYPGHPTSASDALLHFRRVSEKCPSANVRLWPPSDAIFAAHGRNARGLERLEVKGPVARLTVKTGKTIDDFRRRDPGARHDRAGRKLQPDCPGDGGRNECRIGERPIRSETGSGRFVVGRPDAGSWAAVSAPPRSSGPSGRP